MLSDLVLEAGASPVAHSGSADAVGARSAAPECGRLYPERIADGWRDATGRLVRIRPIAAADAELIRVFVHSLSVETRYMRFMAAVKQLSPPVIDRLTRLDHRRDAALIAVTDDAGEDRVVGVARYALNAGGRSCEFAIIVADDWQGRGLGRHLLTLLVETAVARGLERMVGKVLAVNRTMLAFVRALGFGVSASADPATRRVHLGLDRRLAFA